MPRNSQPLTEQITSFVAAARTAGSMNMVRADYFAVRAGNTLAR